MTYRLLGITTRSLMQSPSHPNNTPSRPPFQPTLLTHPIYPPYQPTLTPHPINSPYQPTLSTHSINAPYQLTLSTHPNLTRSNHPNNTPSRPPSISTLSLSTHPAASGVAAFQLTLSTNTNHLPYQHILLTHPINPSCSFRHRSLALMAYDKGS